ncbi:(2Fe-2S)-binding protein [Bradyrhizobium mercantei]|uniref:(2Fe-2S)-binding protein n=1 Tax=Bradyrhizobium mercantei TaxID=1904807 RepID=UPI000977AF3C|nr:(2Fe-2S)-binding protein [Bradyrhizobium mercantei]
MNKIANVAEGPAIETVQINVEVNGVAYTRYVEPRLLLSDFLRQELGLTGTHVGCEHGVCGSCNVMVDGSTVRSCLVFASQLDNAKIETVESLGRVNALHPLQKAFWEKHGLQCGFCTPGMLMTAKELLDRNPRPTRDEIREAISGNLCRCTGYQTIIEAIYSAAYEMQGATNG